MVCLKSVLTNFDVLFNCMPNNTKLGKAGPLKVNLKNVSL